MDLPSAQPSFSQHHENDHSHEDAVSRADVVDMLEMYPFTEYSEYEAAREVVKRLPSVTPKAEQPEIIRCRDCKYHRIDNQGIRYCCRKEYGYGWGDNDFCSDAERREEGGK